ncbi:flagellar motor protein MotB [Enterocloster aldenensis]|uniref:OmpA/MotB family protein n=1 Tax=Enterocloster aldenensis TaxID=358742 RepID=UPI000E3F9C42|nr:flagellar motor protein MotB [Enterocloster aldenensis]
MKRQMDEEGGQEWLNTYADMITLVLTFFVLLYSISNVNISKLEEIATAMQRQLGIEVQTDIEDVPQDLKYPVIGENTKEAIQVPAGSQNTQASAREMARMARDIQTYFDTENLDAMVSNSENAVFIRFKNDLLFDPDSAVLRADSRSMLDAVGIMLKEKQDDILAVYINGHTAQAANSLINDRLLSSERADNVAIYLEEQVGFDPKKLICRGYGKYYPIADNATREGREQNRRVDIIILGNGYKPEDTIDGVETMDPLFPVTMPGDKAMMQEGTGSD